MKRKVECQGYSHADHYPQQENVGDNVRGIPMATIHISNGLALEKVSGRIQKSRLLKNELT